MKCILPLPAIQPATKEMLFDIFLSCKRKVDLNNPRCKVTSWFPEEEGFNTIIEKIVKPIGIDPNDVEDLCKDANWLPYNCQGISFTHHLPGDYTLSHRDYNPAKLNILLWGDPIHHMHFINEDEYWDYKTPAIMSIFNLHEATNMPVVRPRVHLQIFLKREFEYYRNTVNHQATW